MANCRDAVNPLLMLTQAPTSPGAGRKATQESSQACNVAQKHMKDSLGRWKRRQKCAQTNALSSPTSKAVTLLNFKIFELSWESGLELRSVLNGLH